MRPANIGQPLLFIHSSNELYGSDRMLLEVLATLPLAMRDQALVWIPDDSEGSALTERLSSLGFAWRILPLPVLRRQYFSLRGLFGRLRNAFSAWLAMTRLRPSVVYCTTSASLGSAPVARAAGARRVFLHVQEVWSGGEVGVLSVLASLTSDRICISRTVESALPRHLRRRSTVILNSVPDSALVVRSAAENTGPLTFLMASRWSPTKGYETLLRAWVDGPPPGQLHILGGMPPNGNGIDVRSLLKDLGSPETVEVLGEVEHIDQYLVAADFLIFPSDTPEGFGLLAVEAFRNARAVIASRSGGLNEVVKEGVTGHTFAPRDSDGLRAILSSCTRSEAASMGRAARITYETQYSSDRYAADFQTVWSSLGICD
ncbi:glycosyltransferase [Pseudarthrobacter sp. NPDC080039]|uniref:glycosyltransferase family 4 protein n=1 Tax=unclassified Pseudarthrobacter TaxID=2647000 RepID=UPI00344F03E4